MDAVAPFKPLDRIAAFAAIVLADLRQRSRSVRFWLMIGAVAAATWWMLPAPDADYATLTLLDDSRGRYSSAWIGMTLAMVYSGLLSLGGFYLIRGTLARDIDTRAWQLLMATPMTRGGYLLAKWTSHMVVFALIALSGVLVGLLRQWQLGEDPRIDLVEALKPILVLSLPGLALTAALALWFDLLPWLRRTAGNVLYFVLWVILLSSSVAPMTTDPQQDDRALRSGWMSDPNGMLVAGRSFVAVREAQTGKRQEFGFNIGVQNTVDAKVTHFAWDRWEVPAAQLPGRALWLALALLATLAAAPLLDWAAARGSSVRSRDTAGRQLRWLDRLLSPLARGAFGTLAVAELKLALRQRRIWWWLAALGVMGAQLFASEKGLYAALLLAWVLPLDVLARGALREREHATAALMFTAPNMLGRLLAVRFAVACGLLLALSLPGLLRLSLHAPDAAFAAGIVLLSLASWGLCLGAITGNGRLFELLLVFAVYVGLQGAAVFDLQQAPLQTALAHGLALLPAWALLGWRWPRLAQG